MFTPPILFLSLRETLRNRPRDPHADTGPNITEPRLERLYSYGLERKDFAYLLADLRQLRQVWYPNNFEGRQAQLLY